MPKLEGFKLNKNVLINLSDSPTTTYKDCVHSFEGCHSYESDLY